MIRPAKFEEAEAIQNLLLRYTENGQVLYRPLAEIEANIGDFLVAVIDEKIVGACSLKTAWSGLAEIRSLCIDPGYYRQGIGTALVRECVERGLALGRETAFVLTYAVRLFEKLGFTVVEKSTLPMKIWNDCKGCIHQERCDETAMVLPLIPLQKNDPATLAETG